MTAIKRLLGIGLRKGMPKRSAHFEDFGRCR
jgi:hypothetical protein